MADDHTAYNHNNKLKKHTHDLWCKHVMKSERVVLYFYGDFYFYSKVLRTLIHIHMFVL